MLFLNGSILPPGYIQGIAYTLIHLLIFLSHTFSLRSMGIEKHIRNTWTGLTFISENRQEAEIFLSCISI
jgi:hypothetical protein